MSDKPEYYAFISYKREDIKEAKRLQRALEYYRLPNKLRQENSMLPEYVRPVFRDMTDLEVGELSAQIHSALEQSHYLIVVCSPRAASSKWVNDEVDYFISLGKQEKIIPYIIEGVPHADISADECYPPALLNLSKDKELLGANINEVGKDSAMIRVVSRMFNIRFDALYKRYEREQRRKKMMWMACSILIACIGLSIGWYFIKQNARINQSQSHFIAEKAERLIEGGDVFLAARLLMNRTQSALFIPEIEYGLRKVYNVFEQSNATVSIIGTPYGKEDGYNINTLITNDGSKCVYTKDKSLLVINAFNGKTIVEKTLNEFIFNVELCDNDNCVIISGESGTAYMLSLLSGEVLYSLVCGEDIIEDIAINDKSGLIAICSGENLKIWNYYGEQIQSYEFSGNIRYLNFNPAGTQIAVSNNNRVDLYSIATNSVIDSVIHEDFCYGADFSDDGRLLSTCSDDCMVKIWSLVDGALVREFKFKDYVSTALIDITGNFVVTESGAGHEIRILNIETGDIGDVIRGKYLVKVKGKPTIIDESANGYLNYFSPFSPSARMIIPTNGSVVSMDFNGDNALISTTEGLTKLWITGPDKTSAVFAHSDYTNSLFHGKYMIRDIQTDYYSNIVATIGDDCLVKLWSYPSFNEAGTFRGHSREPHTVRFSSNEKYVLTSSYDGTAILWDRKNRSPIHILPHKASVEKADFIHNDEYIMTISGHDIVIWSVMSGKQVRILHVERSTPSLNLWEPDGDDVIDAVYVESLNQVFASYRNGIIRLWEFSGERVKEFNVHHQKAIICYSYKLAKLISWSENGELYTWDVPSFEQTELNGHSSDITAAKLLHNGYELISSDDNGNIFLWDLRTGEMERKLCGEMVGINDINISENDEYLLALTYDDVLKVISISDFSLLMEYENSNFYLCPIMNKECDAIIAPLGNGWINVYQFPAFENLIQRIEDIMQDVTLDHKEKKKYLFE